MLDKIEHEKWQQQMQNKKKNKKCQKEIFVKVLWHEFLELMVYFLLA